MDGASVKGIGGKEAAPARAKLATRIHVLGGFELWVGGVPITLPPASQRILAFLVLENRPLTRAYAAGRLWPDASEQRAFGNLRSALWRIRRRAPRLVSTESDTFRIASGVWIDVLTVVESARRVLGGRGVCAEEDLEASRFANELLPDWYDDWIYLERERLRQLCLHTLEAIALELAEARRFAEAMEAAFAAIALEPLRETSHKMLVQMYLAEGNRWEATRHTKRFEQLVEAEFGEPPSDEFLQLARAFGAA